MPMSARYVSMAVTMVPPRMARSKSGMIFLLFLVWAAGDCAPAATLHIRAGGRLRDYCRFLQVPIGDFLIAMHSAQERRFSERSADQLERHRHAIRREPAWHADRRNPEVVHNLCIARERNDHVEVVLAPLAARLVNTRNWDG